MKAHHISLLTGDFKQNYDFYTGVLGMRFIKNSINQANAHMRHVYYGDFLGTPGTVVTFFPDEVLDRPRLDGRMFFGGIHFAIPTGTIEYWTNRFNDKGFSANVEDGILKVLDPDQIPLEFHEQDGVQFDWHVNFMSDVPAENQILGIIGTTLNVPDVSKTGEFFSDLLGLEVKDGKIILDEGQAIILNQTAEGAEESKFGKGSVDHFALAVERGTDLDYLWKRAEDRGWTQETYVDRGYFNSVYFIEPGGNRVEIATTNPGFTLDESVEDLGTTFAMPPRFDGSREQLKQWWHDKGVDFNDQEPYTGTGKINNEPVRPINVTQGNTHNN
jgi:catechol 2,3-dioxygenase-like lactoylglutathione lyase family enzyme